MPPLTTNRVSHAAVFSLPRPARPVSRTNAMRARGLGLAFALAASLFGTPRFAQAAAAGLDRMLLENAIEQLAVPVEQEYFDAKLAAAAATILREGLRAGRYDDLTSRSGLADRVTAELFDLTNDKHLAVSTLSNEGPPPGGQERSDLAREDRGKRDNFGVQRVEILPGNVGYLNLTSFYRPDEARDALAAAMPFSVMRTH